MNCDYLVIANCINCAAKLNRSCIASTKKWIVKMFIFVLIYDWSNATNSLQYPPRSMCWNSAQYKFSESGMDVCIGNGQLTRYASWLQLLHMLNVFFIGKTKSDFVHWKVAKLHPRMPKTNYRWKLLFLHFTTYTCPTFSATTLKVLWTSSWTLTQKYRQISIYQKLLKSTYFYLSQHVVTELLIGLHCVSEKTPP